MLHILFLILKIIGIIILIVLALILLLLTMVLFIPVRYKIDATAEGDLKSLSLHAKASWILNVLSLNAIYEQGKFVWSLRIMGVKVRKRNKKSSSVEAYSEDEHTANKSTEPENVRETEYDMSGPNTKKRSFWQKIKCTIQKICAKIKKILKSAQNVHEFLINETHRLAFGVLKSELFSLAKHIRPRTLKGTIRYGLDDPYHTGLVLAGLSVLYPFLDERLSIYPDFEKQVLEGQVYVKGRMRAVIFLKMICKLFFDKNIKQTYKNLKNKR